MNRKVAVNGFCPMQNKDFAITIEYLDTNTYNQLGKSYIKGMFACSYTYQNKCSFADDCPIYKDVPDEITE